jgi:DNA polymerase-1
MRTNNLIVDGKNLLHRTSDAFKSLTIEINDREIGCGGMYGFLKSLIRIHAKFGGKVWIAWEGKREDNFRFELFPEYKKRREYSEEEIEYFQDMKEQEIRLKIMLRLIGVRQFESIDGEADDVMACLAGKFQKKFESVIIYTADSDLCQLVKGGPNPGNVVVVTPGYKGREIVYDSAASVKDKHGVYPRLLPDLKALAGDSADNIPGVPSIGPVTAVALINEYSSVKNVILAAAGKDYGRWPVAERFRQKIIDARKNVLLYKKLTKLSSGMEIKEIKSKRNKKLLIKHFNQYKFRSLLASSELIDIMRLGG